MSGKPMRQWCAVCGKEQQSIHGTAHVQCCGGLGYWSSVKPENNWPAKYALKTKLYFYPGPKWNAEELAKWRKS